MIEATGQTTVSLLDAVRAGDEKALDLLYRRYLPLLTKWAQGRLPQRARGLLDTEDLVQETVLRSLDHVDRFERRHTGSFLAYLRQGVRNRVRDEMRRLARSPSEDGTVGRLADLGPSATERLVGRQALDIYETALATLSPVDREAVIARFELGLSFAEIAQVIDKPSPDAARMAVKRAVLRLADLMADHA